MNLVDAKIALVHDWFLKNSMGGAEKVTLFIDKLLKKNYSELNLGDSVFIITEGNQILERSQAIKYCLKYVKLNYFLKTIIKLSPNFLLNIFYRLIAKNRYFLFGKRNTCYLP